MYFSLIIPVFNRPDEVEDLFKCLKKQTYTNFEVVLVESGSSIPSDKIVEKYNKDLTIQHYMYKNAGQGFSRNHGMTKAKGDFFIILDSDILVNNDYLENVYRELKNLNLDAFGGPDKAHASFSSIQKAIDYSLTSFWTTGGIRGRRKRAGKFYPRSFNMGFSRKVYEQTKGFNLPYFGEDIELSKRIMEKGFRTDLIPSAFVYHKRKKTLSSFYKQMFFFGRARINIFLLFRDTIKLAHFFPLAFLLLHLFLVALLGMNVPAWWKLSAWSPVIVYNLINLVAATAKHRSILVGILSIGAVYTQMTGYALGFIKEFFDRIVLKKNMNAKNKKE